MEEENICARIFPDVVWGFDRLWHQSLEYKVEKYYHNKWVKFFKSLTVILESTMVRNNNFYEMRWCDIGKCFWTCSLLAINFRYSVETKSNYGNISRRYCSTSHWSTHLAITNNFKQSFTMSKAGQFFSLRLMKESWYTLISPPMKDMAMYQWQNKEFHMPRKRSIWAWIWMSS